MSNFFARCICKATSNKCLMTFMVIVGTVIGSGFLSGKEIVVFFSRFGKMSYFCIFLAFLLFWGLFYFFLKYAGGTLNRLASSKYAKVLNFLICLILSAAMFAGIIDLLSSLWFPIQISIIFIMLLICSRIALKGASVLEKLNLFLVPIMIVFLIINLISLLSLKTSSLFVGGYYPYSIFFCVLYVILNTSNSAIVISNFSKELTQKQKVQVSFSAALALFIILLFANIVLLQNSFAFGQEMPLLYLVKGVQKILMSIIMLIGCSTTLFSLVYTISSSLRGVHNKFFLLFFSVGLPFALSFLGFGLIVSYCYPLTSVLGIFLLCDLFCIPFFKKVYKGIHSTRKNTKQEDTGHDKV